jgi:hypothetical protein
MSNERDPLELKVLGMLPGRTIDLPDGSRIATADARWGELSSTWHLPRGAGDVFEEGWEGNSASSGRGGFEPGRSMLVFAVRARVHSLEAGRILANEQGGDWNVALHYYGRVQREQRLNFLMREDLLLGTPLPIRERLMFGLFIVPGHGAVSVDCNVTFSLVGFLIGGKKIAEDQTVRFAQLYAETHGPNRKGG